MKQTATQLERVMQCLREGPTTSSEAAAETGLSLKHCSSYLTSLKRQGIVEVNGRLNVERCEHCGRKPSGQHAAIYSLVDGKRA